MISRLTPVTGRELTPNISAHGCSVYDIDYDNNDIWNDHTLSSELNDPVWRLLLWNIGQFGTDETVFYCAICQGRQFWKCLWKCIRILHHLMLFMSWRFKQIWLNWSLNKTYRKIIIWIRSLYISVFEQLSNLNIVECIIIIMWTLAKNSSTRMFILLTYTWQIRMYQVIYFLLWNQHCLHVFRQSLEKW